MLEKAIRAITVVAVFLFPLIYVKGFAFPGIFPRAMFIFFICELLFFLFLWYSFSKRDVEVKKSYITSSIFLYIIVLFIGALSGPDFLQSFWSSFFRMTGIITWLHYFSFLLVVSSFFTEEKDWRNLFRTVLFSGLVLAIVSYLGADGLNLSPFSGIKEGGSLFGNTSYSGAYYLLVFFISLIGFSLESKKVWKGIYIFGLIFIFFNPDLFNFHTILGMARASSLVLWAGLLIIFSLFLLHKFTSKKTVIIVSTIILIFISIFYIYGFHSLLGQESKIYEAYLKESGPARILVWNMAVEGIKNKPFFGYGSENFNYVYQENLNSKIINIEQSTEWFDNVHNFALAQILEGGLVGGLVFFVVFLLVVFKSFKLYLADNKFYLLIIPLILVFHFLQMQTFFQTDSTLFIIFTLLAFIISHEKNIKFKIPLAFNMLWPKLVLTALFIVVLYFFVYVPAKENLLISRILTKEERGERLELYKHLCCLKVYPRGTLSLLSSKFMGDTASRASAFLEAGVTKNVAEEYSLYLQAYEKYLPRYENNYRYIIEYASLINTAFVFDVDELKRGEELAHMALKISKSYPHPYWVLALNLYYQKRFNESFAQAQAALNVDREIGKSIDLYNNIKEQLKISPKERSFMYFPI